jgi:hypothetical protein
MLTFKPAGQELEDLQQAARLLKNANAATTRAEKEIETAKAKLSQWLLAERNTNLDTLDIGALVNIEDVALIEIGQMTKFDEKTFALAKPGLHAEYLKPRRVKRFKPAI